jgi:hypothetical protein
LGAVCPFGLSEPLPCPIRFNPCAHSFHCCRTRLTNLHGTALPTCLIDCRIEHRARRATCCERVNLSCLVPPHIRRRRGDSKLKACGLCLCLSHTSAPCPKLSRSRIRFPTHHSLFTHSHTHHQTQKICLSNSVLNNQPREGRQRLSGRLTTQVSTHLP